MTQQIKGNWNVIKGRFKKAYGSLTDDDLTYIEGKEDELLGKIQHRIGKSRQEVEELVEKFSRPNTDGGC